MILFSAAGPKLFINHADLLKNEFVLWQEHNRLLISQPTEEKPFESLFYNIRWQQPKANHLIGNMEIDGQPFGTWDATAAQNRIDLTFTVTNITDQTWPVAETSMCYKHRGAVDFWDPDLERTYIEWQGVPIPVRDRIRTLHGPNAFWPKNQFHLEKFAHTCDRYARVGLHNPPSAGWQVHPSGATSGWMAIVSKDGNWLSGIFWETTERVAQNGPDYGCMHAGLSIGYDIAPGQTVRRKGTILLAQMTPKEFMDLYHGEVKNETPHHE